MSEKLFVSGALVITQCIVPVPAKLYIDHKEEALVEWYNGEAGHGVHF